MKNSKNDLTSFWSFISEKKSHNKIPSTMKFSDNSFDNAEDISGAFASFFESVYTRDDNYSGEVSNYGYVKFSVISRENPRKSVKSLK